MVPSGTILCATSAKSGLVSCFLTKKRAKGEILDTIATKNPYNRTTIFLKRNGFFAGYIVFFLLFFDKK